MLFLSGLVVVLLIVVVTLVRDLRRLRGHIALLGLRFHYRTRMGSYLECTRCDGGYTPDTTCFEYDGKPPTPHEACCPLFTPRGEVK